MPISDNVLEILSPNAAIKVHSITESLRLLSRSIYRQNKLIPQLLRQSKLNIYKPTIVKPAMSETLQRRIQHQTIYSNIIWMDTRHSQSSIVFNHISQSTEAAGLGLGTDGALQLYP